MSEGNAITRPVLRWHGGKWGSQGHIAAWIVARLPPHRVYVEPFGGAGSVLLAKPRSHAEVYGDLAGNVVEAFQVLRDRPEALRRACALTPYARAEFDRAFAEPDPPDPVERARRTILRAQMGFASAGASGKYRTGFRANSDRSNTTPAQDWANWPGFVAAWAERLRGVVMENRDAFAVMRQHDGPDTLFYLDPPYLPDTRQPGNSHHKPYVHDLDAAGHDALLAFVRHELEGMVVLSAYPSARYDAALADWVKEARSARADGAGARTEVLWSSPRAWAARHAVWGPLAEVAP